MLSYIFLMIISIIFGILCGGNFACWQIASDRYFLGRNKNRYLYFSIGFFVAAVILDIVIIFFLIGD